MERQDGEVDSTSQRHVPEDVEDLADGREQTIIRIYEGRICLICFGILSLTDREQTQLPRIRITRR